MSNKFDLIIFDWDGTLSNSVGLITDLIIDSFNELGIKPPNRHSISLQFGIKLEHALLSLLPKKDVSKIDNLLDTYKTFFKKYSGQVNLFEGVEFGIKELKKQGYLLAIATGGSRGGFNNAINQTSLDSFFNLTKTSNDCFSKPHPQMILEILEELMVLPEKALMVGDSIHDLQMAKSAGISSLAILYGSQTKKQLEGNDALGYINDSYALFEWIRING